MSKFSLNGFKKISKTADTTTLQHPAGHELTIKHTLLSPKLRGDIEALPHISEKHPDTVAPKAPTVPKFAEGSKEPVQAEENGPDAADRRITEQNAAEESKSKSETESKADADKAAYEAYQSRQPATEDTRPGRSNIDDLIESHKNLTDSHNAIVQAVAGNQQSNPQS